MKDKVSRRQNCFDKKKYLIILFPFVRINFTGDRHLNANRPLNKHHLVGDEPSQHSCYPLTKMSP